MDEVRRSPLPVAATPAVFFMKLQQYAPDSVRSRVSYPADEQLALKYEGIFTGETNLLRFSRGLPLRVPRFDHFNAQNPHFLLCAETTRRRLQNGMFVERRVGVPALRRFRENPTLFKS